MSGKMICYNGQNIQPCGAQDGEWWYKVRQDAERCKRARQMQAIRVGNLERRGHVIRD